MVFGLSATGFGLSIAVLISLTLNAAQSLRATGPFSKRQGTEGVFPRVVVGFKAERDTTCIGVLFTDLPIIHRSSSGWAFQPNDRDAPYTSDPA